MRVIIAGSRTIDDPSVLKEVFVYCGWDITTVVSGTARGADRLGEDWAEANDIPVLKFPADWNRHGRKAGFIRNTEMAKNADALIALWDGKSRGTAHLINIARQNNLAVHIHNVEH